MKIDKSIPRACSRGGLVVVLFFFFVLAFFLTTVLIYWSGAGWIYGSNNSTEEFGTFPKEGFNKSTEKIIRPFISPVMNLKPQEVVQLQLDALSEYPYREDGIKQCYEFASPRNKQAVGEIAQFSRMLRKKPYGFMMQSLLSLTGNPRLKGNSARITVTLLDAEQNVHGYVFELSRQSAPPYENCWMTDAVYPLSSVGKTKLEPRDSTSVSFIKRHPTRG